MTEFDPTHHHVARRRRHARHTRQTRETTILLFGLVIWVLILAMIGS